MALLTTKLRAAAPLRLAQPSLGRPWLSVVMPTYNGRDHLPRALASIAAQGDENIEVLAVDDGSTDETLAILEAFARQLPLSIVRRPHAGNWAANTNHGLNLARGDWVCFLHQDDSWLAGRLAALKNKVDQHPDATLFLHPSWYVDDRGRRLGLWSCPLPAHRIPGSMFMERLLVQNFISMPAPLVSRKAALRTGGLDESLWYTADWDFWLKLAPAGDVVYLRRPLSTFGLHAKSQTISRSADLDGFRNQLNAVLDRHLPLCPAPEPRRKSIERVARFSIDLNATLAGSLQRRRPNYSGLASELAHLGPRGWYCFFRDSRIVERVGARLRARMLR
jgi:hypothetical protein